MDPEESSLEEDNGELGTAQKEEDDAWERGRAAGDREQRSQLPAGASSSQQ